MKSKCFLLFKVQFFNQVNVKSKAKSQIMVMVSMGILVSTEPVSRKIGRAHV